MAHPGENRIHIWRMTHAAAKSKICLQEKFDMSRYRLSVTKGRLPIARDLPPHLCQQGRNLTVTPFIPLNFQSPVCAIGFGASKSVRMPVPKISVKEDGNTLADENKIRTSRKFAATSPTLNLVTTQELNKLEFGCFVAATLNHRHHSRALVRWFNQLHFDPS
jgi:hypothetical protein